MRESWRQVRAWWQLQPWPHLQAAGGEGAGKDDALGALADVDEAAAAGRAPGEAVHVHVALCIHLRDLSHAVMHTVAGTSAARPRRRAVEIHIAACTSEEALCGQEQQ